jgi:hypothetical protein
MAFRRFAAVLLARGNVLLLILDKDSKCNQFMAGNENGTKCLFILRLEGRGCGLARLETFCVSSKIFCKIAHENFYTIGIILGRHR